MYEQKMDSTFSEELEAMEALEAYVSRLFFYDVTTCMIWIAL